jgi:DNA-binding NarL/FixJ family response regulator
MNDLQILVADNQAFTRAGIITILSDHFSSNLNIEQIKNKEKLFKRLLEIKPQILIIDFNLFDFDLRIDLPEIKKIAPTTGILAVSDNQSPEDLRKVLECGITNYILKSSHEQELIEAVNATIGNRKYFSSQILDVLLALKTASRKIYLNKGHAHITYTEQEIIKLITQGLTTREIATLKNLSYHTVITHRKNIFRKLAIGSSSELILYAMHAGIVDTTDYYI